MRLGALTLARVPAIAGIALLALFLHGGLLAALVQILGVPAVPAQVTAAVFSLAMFCGGMLWFANPQRAQSGAAERGWDRFCLAVVIYAVTLRLVYLGVPDRKSVV